MRTNIIRIRKTLYARIPAAEGRRLHLAPGQEVDLDVRPRGSSPPEIMSLHGKYKGRFRTETGGDLWGGE